MVRKITSLEWGDSGTFCFRPDAEAYGGTVSHSESPFSVER